MHKPQTVYVLIIDHRHGRNISVSASAELAQAALAGYCEDWWEEAQGRDDRLGACPEDNDELISDYFEAMADDESYEIEACPVYEGSAAEVAAACK